MNLRPSKLSSPLFGNDHDVPLGQKLAILAAKQLSQQSLEAVPYHRVADLGADGNPQSALTCPTRLTKKNEMRGMNLPAPAEQIQKLGAFGETGGFRIGLRVQKHPSTDLCVRPFRWNCDGQSFAPFGSSALQDFLPARRCHPFEKTVRPLASQITRLVGSFHAIVLPARRPFSFNQIRSALSI